MREFARNIRGSNDYCSILGYFSYIFDTAMIIVGMSNKYEISLFILVLFAVLGQFIWVYINHEFSSIQILDKKARMPQPLYVNASVYHFIFPFFLIRKPF
jgi:hypothetical protein